MSKFLLSCFADEISPDLEEQVRVLKSTDIRHIEIRGVGGVNVSNFTISQAKEYNKYLSDNGFGISSIGSPIGKIKISDSFKEHLDLFKHCLELAEIFSAPYIRMFSFYYDEGVDPESILPDVCERWQKFIDAANGTNIVLLHENEKDIYGDLASRELKLINSLNSDKVKLVFDPANFLQSGERNLMEKYNLLKPYIEYFHIKDHSIERGQVVPAGMGDGNLKEILSAAKADGFEGFLSIEPHLQNFAGLSAFEKHTDIVSSDNKEGNKFMLAYDSLMRILNEI